MAKIKLRLHGSEMLASLKLDENYEIYTDSLWTSLFTLVGNKDAEAITDTDYLMISQKFLRTDISKTAEKNIKNQKGDYLVLDMLNTAYARMVEIDNQVYTMSPVFTKSQFCKVNKDKIKYLDCLHTGFEAVKPYFDAYIEMIKRNYDKDKIILIKTYYPEYYVYSNQIRPWNVTGNRREKINEMLKILEDYFIERVHPYVIESVKYYYCGFDSKTGLFLANYEEECRDTVKRAIKYITVKKPAKRIVYGYNVNKRYRRFARFYDSLLFFNEENLFINPDNFTDSVVLKLNKELIAEYADKLSEIYKKSPQSIDDILNSDIELENDLRTAFLLIKAVNEKKYLNKMLPYERIFTDKLNIRNKIMDDVKEYFSDFDGFDSNIISMPALPEYFRLMQLFMDDDYGEIFKMAHEREQLNAHKVKKIKKKNSKVKAEPLPTVHIHDEAVKYLKQKQSDDSVSVDFWGSAFGIEVLEKLNMPVQLNNKYIGSSPLYDFEEPIEHKEDYLEEVLEKSDDPFIEQLAHSLRRNIHNELQNNHSEWLIIDLISLTGDCVKYQEDEACMRASVPMRKMKPFLEAKPQNYLICYSWEDDEEKIKKDMDLFIEFVKQTYGDKVILICGDIKSYYIDENGLLARYLDRTRDNIINAKKFLLKWQKYFIRQTDCYCVDSMQYYFADSNTLSVSRRYHMEKEYYDDACGRIRRILKGDAPKTETTVNLVDMAEKVRKVVKNNGYSPAILTENINYPKK